MAALVCDICGGKLVMQSGGVAKCDSCGMEYTKERIQEKVQEIKGTVKIDGPVETVKGDAEKERLLNMANDCLNKGNLEEQKDAILEHERLRYNEIDKIKLLHEISLIEEEISKQNTVIKSTQASLENANDVYNGLKTRNHVATVILIISIIGFIILFKISTIGAICCIGGGILAELIDSNNNRHKNAKNHCDKLSGDLKNDKSKLNELETKLAKLKKELERIN